MEETVKALLTSGKGLLAADESFPTLGKRFEALGIACSEETRRDYRELLFTAPGLSEFISGVILFDETIRQAIGGAPVPQILDLQGIIPGIKVDLGTAALANFSGEKATQGLDGLRERLAAYRDLGARFTKWRAVVSIGHQRPTPACIASTAHGLARFAALSQEAGLVPIVEPEILMDGTHTLAQCEDATGATLKAVFAALADHRVALETLVLKTGMVLAGKDCPQPGGTARVAEATLRCLRRTVPAAVPGIVFLSGGQNDEAATGRLNAICGVGGPWRLSYSFGRALQDRAMAAWAGLPARAAAAQQALLHRAACNSLAVQGRYTPDAERGGIQP